MDVLRELGPALRLNAVGTSHDWLRFDSAGDFQLILRDDFLAIDGLDERMVLGSHVDANLGKRMLLRRGSIDSLENELAGYHCNHLRTRRPPGSPVTNDLHRFVVALEQVDLRVSAIPGDWREPTSRRSISRPRPGSGSRR